MVWLRLFENPKYKHTYPLPPKKILHHLNALCTNRFKNILSRRLLFSAIYYFCFKCISFARNYAYGCILSWKSQSHIIILIISLLIVTVSENTYC